LVGEPRVDSGNEIKRQLGILGVKKVRVMGDFEQVSKSVANDEADLCLCNMQTQSNAPWNMMRGVREQEVGQNPFMVLVSMVGSTQRDELAHTIDAGPDDLMMRPFSRDVFVRRMNELAARRKKFVVTSEYVGPTRRTEARNEDDGGGTEEFDVPNPMRVLGFGGDREEMWRDIHAASKQLNARKLRADIRLFDALVRDILPAYENGAIDDEFFAYLGKLLKLLAGIERRARRIGDENLIDLCALSENILTDIKERPSPPNLRNVGALPKLVTGFKFALNAIS
jgi:hypothetical protein